MRSNWTTKLGVMVVVLIAFIDGVIVADHFLNADAGEADSSSPEFLTDWASFFGLEGAFIEETDSDLSGETKGDEDLNDETTIDEPLGLDTIDEEVIVELPEEVVPEILTKSVPYTTQAPVGAWASNPWAYMAEEATILMAHAWVQGETELNPTDVMNGMLAMAAWEEDRFESYGDHKAQEILEIFHFHLNYPKVYLSSDLDTLSYEVENGSIVILSVNGQVLGNPYYGDPAPEHHTLLIKDFNSETSEYTVHDPGTSQGRDYIYLETTLKNAALALDEQSIYVVIRP